MTGRPVIDTTTPNMARVYDYWLGGKDNFEADRQLAEAMAALDCPRPASPGVLLNRGVVQRARDNRAFVVKAVSRAADAGIGQFLDLGAGLPTFPSVHEAARAVRPDSAVAYVDNDEVAHCHLANLLAAGDGLAASGADLTDPEAVLEDKAVVNVIDFGRPVCVILAAVAQFISADQFRAITAAYADAMAPGSWLVLSSARFEDPELLGALQAMYTPAPLMNHDPETFRSWFSGLALVSPGITSARRWVRGGCLAAGLPKQAGYMIAGVAVKSANLT